MTINAITLASPSPWQSLLGTFFVIQLIGFLGCSSQSQKRGLEHPTIPIKYESAAQVEPIHKLTLAVLPIKDSREWSEGTDSAYRYTYRGKSYRFTDLRGLKRGLSNELSGHIAQILHRKSIFRKILLVSDSSDAADADLILTAAVKRARGYVEDLGFTTLRKDTQVSTSTSARQVLAEFVLDNVRLRQKKSGKLLFDSDFGWSIFESRAVREDEEAVAAFGVLSDAVLHVLNQLSIAIKESDLSGDFFVQQRVTMSVGQTDDAILAALAEVLPQGWNITETSSVTAPLGWSTKSKICDKVRLSAAQSWKFHRAIGPYRPTLAVWACPAKVELSYMHSSSKNAEYLGKKSDGTNFFVLGLGETNWADYRRELRTFFKLTAPIKRHIFRLKPFKQTN